ncbi:hypothetical protein Poli38472_003733 [Pythium oligandrum]|uniref:ABC transporter domain-containing protein n=1 Tax=Pythium oligandrum TaxID=41045 RepID=A0A8K1FPU5_PYTOL|nr:hypothetical protein Poli38472_003733 [Pythium oligandrum]|eukprot:TMW65968.1 hypothetical protein Poli38472_003733 [Pythium oligandrum]
MARQNRGGHGLEHGSGKALLAQGPEKLHEYVTSTMEAAMKRAMPRMEIRFRDLSLSADDLVKKEDAKKQAELPTLVNEVKSGFGGLCTRKIVVQKPILHEISGVFRPGTMTLVLGQPGSGKSSLLKVLSGRFPVTKNTSLQGSVTYNGVHQGMLNGLLPQFVAYVTQDDKHLSLLTVKETLEYAHKFSGIQLPRHTAEMLKNGSPEETKAAQEAIRSMFEHYPEIIIEQLGLTNCEDTILGDAMIRGVSGGERKRVTLGEMEFGLKYVSFMDEISTGLDSAATYDIIKAQRSIADKFKKTIVMSLLQPTPEVVALFDDIMLLNEGHVMYYGPRMKVMKYFEDLGLSCPPHRDPADFLMDIGTNQQEQYVNERSRAGIPRTAAEFGALYKQSEVYARILDELEEPQDPTLMKDVKDHINPTPLFHQPYFGNFSTLLQRQLRVTFRNKALLIGRVASVLVIGLLYASVFYQFEVRDVQVVMGTLFATVFFVAMSQYAQLPMMVMEREIFYKQRAANLVRSSTYVTSYLISQIPICLLEVLILGSLTHWMCGFADSAIAFINYIVILFLLNFCFTGWYMVLAAWTPNLHVVEPLGMVSLLFFVLFAGFVIFRGQLPNYLEWLYWINPVAWSLRATAVNQYRSEAYDVCTYEGTQYCKEYNLTMGQYYLDLYDVPSESYWVEYGMLYLFGLAIVLVTFAGYLLEYKRYETPENHDTVAKSEDDLTTESTSKKPKDAQYTLLNSPQTVVDVVRRDKHFVPVTLAFKDLRYSVQDPNNPKQQLELLKGITGLALPGSVTALMGASGAGKTTLMDVIAGRKTEGTISGSILMNGYEATDLVIRRSTGYCEQVDVHLESATFREALTFSAFLRQSSDIPDATKFDSVNECLELLDLTPLADRIIRGSTIEQRKRLTIGVELAAQPSVIFLDEPTSGLDARSAKVIMDGVRKVADSGRTIVCTIHQPSAEVFYLFDSLLLLKKGGETVFYGDLGSDCRNLIDYFESISGLKPLPSNYNPATWMLECIGAGVSNEVAVDVDFVEHFKASEHRRILDERLDKDGVTRPADGVAELKFANKRAASGATQFRFLLRRSFALYWRSASYNLTRLVISLVLALLFWLVFGSADYTTYQGLSSGIGMVFLTSLFNGIVAFNSVLPIAIEERNVFYRERAGETYNAFWFFMASTIVEIPYVFTSGLIFTAIFFPAVGFEGLVTGVLYWVAVSLLILMQTYFGLFIAYAFPTVEVAAVVGILLNTIFLLFVGYLPPTSKIPKGYKWLTHITPQHYPFLILSSLVFSDCDQDPVINYTTGEVLQEGGSQLGCQVLLNTPRELGTITVKGFAEGLFKMEHDDIWFNFAITLVFVVVFRVFGLLALRFVNHQKR